MKKKYITSALFGFATVAFCALMAGCSKSTPPPPPPAATNAAVVKPVEVVVPPVVVETQAVTKVTPPLPAASTNAVKGPLQQPDPERVKALKERQREFAKKKIAEEIPKVEAELAAVAGQANDLQRALSATNEVLKKLFESQQVAHQGYMQARLALPGMPELLKKRDQLKSRIAELKAKLASDLKPDEATELQAATKEMQAMTAEVFKIEMVGRSERAELALAVSNMHAADKACDAGALAFPEYAAIEKQKQKIIENQFKLYRNQAVLAKEIK